jgi:murein DD-endopeptidase MepM/ murein hydrolase activator NlpD
MRSPIRDVVRYNGAVPGIVKETGRAKDRNGNYLGEKVVIVSRDERGVWESKTLHQRSVLVSPGDRVFPGQEIAIGGGAGKQFTSPEAGDPHVHWELRLDSKPVNPLTGELLILTPSLP